MRSSLFILELFKEDKDRDSRRQQGAYLRLTRRLDASPERVFDALVNLETIRTWLFTEPETKFGIDRHVGGNPLAIWG